MIKGWIREIVDRGRVPKMILIHPKEYETLCQQLECSRYIPNYPSKGEKTQFIGSLFGVLVEITSMVKDIYIVDDRSWTDLIGEYKRIVR